MSADEYVPSEEDAADNYVFGRGGDDPGLSLPELRAEYGPEFDRLLARVRQDAAQAALLGAEQHIRTNMDEPYGDRAANRVADYARTYPWKIGETDG